MFTLYLVCSALEWERGRRKSSLCCKAAVPLCLAPCLYVLVTLLLLTLAAKLHTAQHSLANTHQDEVFLIEPGGKTNIFSDFPQAVLEKQIEIGLQRKHYEIM